MKTVSLVRAPVVLFAFKRPDHTKQVLEALKTNPEALETDLIVYCDAGRNKEEKSLVEAVHEVVRSSRGFRSVTLRARPYPFGLFQNIKLGLEEVFLRNESAIVLEDDLVPSVSFLSYMNSALDFYRDDPKVLTISGFLYPEPRTAPHHFDTFFAPRFCCWGWATWKDRWDRFDWSMPDKEDFLRSPLFWQFYEASNDLPEIMLDRLENKNSSWAILVSWNHILLDGLCVYPSTSKIQNIGLDGTGTHSQKRLDFRVKTDSELRQEWQLEREFDRQEPLGIKRYFRNSWRRKVKNFLHYGVAF